MIYLITKSISSSLQVSISLKIKECVINLILWSVSYISASRFYITKQVCKACTYLRQTHGPHF